MIFLIEHPDVTESNLIISHCAMALTNLDEVNSIEYVYARPDVDQMIEALSIQVIVANSLKTHVICTRLFPRDSQGQIAFTNKLFHTQPDHVFVYQQKDDVYSFPRTHLIRQPFHREQTVCLIVDAISQPIHNDRNSANV